MSDRRVALLVGVAGAAAAVAVVAAVARPDAPASGAPDGRVLFVEKGCAACHGERGRAAVVPGVAPTLDDAARWAGGRVAGMSAEEYLAQSIAAPWAFVSPAWSGAAPSGASGPTTRMPALALTDEEIGALVGYLLAPRPDGQG